MKNNRNLEGRISKWLTESLKLYADWHRFIFRTPKYHLYFKDNEYNCATSTTIEVIVSVSNLGMAINSASNFLIYMLRGGKFRRILKKTICRCCFFVEKTNSKEQR